MWVTRPVGIPAAAGAKQVPHLLRGDAVSGPEPVDSDQAGARPATGRLTLGRVVVLQLATTDLGMGPRRNLPGEVLIPRPGDSLCSVIVTPPKAEAQRRVATVRPGWKRCVGT